MLLNCKGNIILQSWLGFQFGLIFWPVVIVILARNAHVIDTSLYLVIYPVKSWFPLRINKASLLSGDNCKQQTVKKYFFLYWTVYSHTLSSSSLLFYNFPPTSSPPPVSSPLLYRCPSTSNQRFVLKINIPERPDRRQLGMHV